jgi:hypothetical protein
MPLYKKRDATIHARAAAEENSSSAAVGTGDALLSRFAD